MKNIIRIGAFLICGLIGGSRTDANGLLIDFGSDTTPTFGGSSGETTYWNNVTTVGTDDFGYLEALMTSDGNFSNIGLQMVSRFNSVNENGTVSSPIYPTTASRDSLYGNTESFNGLSDIAPVFKFYGLDASSTYSFTFFASRTGVSDNRETRFTVTGLAEKFADLNAANNQTNVVVVSNVAPDAASEITIALTPGPNNNNANHFTYLGVLEIKASTGERVLLDFGASGSQTDLVEAPPSAFWNNLLPDVGTTDTGVLEGLVTTNGTPTSIALHMESRFNTSNSSGAANSTRFPTTATQDSLFGNTESFNGLVNISPAFLLTGLDTNMVFSFTFFGSRSGASDNRETRYSVNGANSGEGLLNTSNNTNETVSVSDIRPNESGEIRIAMSAGPNNNNANHFTYLNVLKVDYAPVQTPRVLFDFGDVNQTRSGIDDPENTWNNVLVAVGATDTGVLTNVLRTDAAPTPIALQMVSRFNGVNENGTQAGLTYPINATRDSLFGNTEIFNGISNAAPVFKLIGLSPQIAYDLTFYASRMGVGDNRETRYTVTGATESFVDFNPANNETEVATITDIHPNANGELLIALTPGPNNDNANHFTYLGILQLDWPDQEVAIAPTISTPQLAAGSFKFTITGTANASYKIQRTTNFSSWEDVKTVVLASESQQVEVPVTGNAGFYRVLAQ